MSVIRVYNKFHLFKPLKIQWELKQTYLLSRFWDRSELSWNPNSRLFTAENTTTGFQKPSEKILKISSSNLIQIYSHQMSIEDSRTFSFSWSTIQNHLKKLPKFLTWIQDRPSSTSTKHLARSPTRLTWESCSTTMWSRSFGWVREDSSNQRSSESSFRLSHQSKDKNWWSTPPSLSQQASQFSQSDPLSEEKYHTRCWLFPLTEEVNHLMS